MAKLNLISPPSPPKEYENLDDIVKYLVKLSKYLKDSLDSISKEFNSMLGNGDIRLYNASNIYLGDSSTNGSWRIVRNGNNLSFQRREAGSWVEKGSFSA